MKVSRVNFPGICCSDMSPRANLYFNDRVFSFDVTAAMLVSPINPPGIELYSYANVFFGLGWRSSLFRSSLITWMKTLYCATPLLGRFWSMMFFNLKSVRHVASVWTTQVFCRSKMSLQYLSSYSLRSANGILLSPSIIKTRKTLGYRAFQVAAPQLWNALPLELRQNTNISSFKRCLKTHLFRSAFQRAQF